jgi:cytochrome c-type biogenesis protein CcmH/NrfG
MNRSVLLLLCLSVAWGSGCKRPGEQKQPAAPVPPPTATAATQPSGPDLRPQIAAAEQVVTREPKNADAWVSLGNLYFDAHQPQKAVDAYAEALQLKPDQPGVLSDQGVMYRELKAFEKAAANLEKAHKLAPTHAPTLFNLGLVYADLRQLEKAAAAWNKLIENAPKSPEAANAKMMLHGLNMSAKR